MVSWPSLLMLSCLQILAHHRASWLDHPVNLDRYSDVLSGGKNLCLSLYSVNKTSLLFNVYLFHFLLA